MRTLFATAVRRLSACQRGFTLIEVMLVAATLAVILIAVLSVSDASQQMAPRDQERAHAIREAQTGLHQMTRELRQATEVSVNGPYRIDAEVPFQGAYTLVSYRCDEPHPTNTEWRRCLRWMNGESTIVIDRILNGSTPVFQYVTDADTGQVTYAGVRVVVPAAGDRKEGHPHKVVLDDGFYMRNRNL